MYETREFEFEGRKYEIRIASDGYTIRVRAFLNGVPANGYSYLVDVITAFDIKRSELPVDPLEDLIETAKNDVKKKMWERYLEAVEQLKNQENT